MNIKKFKDFNIISEENIFHDILRIDPRRRDADEKSYKIFQEVVEDYKKFNDLKKVNIIDDKGDKISFEKIEVGKYYTLSYIFGKYHPVKRDIHSGNREHGDRRIKLTSVPFSLTLRKNELEKAFNTSRINMGRNTLRDITTTRLDGKYNENIKEYKISSDMADNFYYFFLNEFNEKYPDLTKSRYKGSMSIRDIEKGVKPTIEYITLKTKDNKDTTVAIRLDDDVKEIKKMVSNMTKKEYDQYYKTNIERLYKPSSDKYDLRKKEVENIILEFLNSNGFKVNDISIKGNIDYDFYIEFRYEENIEKELKEIIKKGIPGYKINYGRMQDAWKNPNIKYYLLEFGKND